METKSMIISEEAVALDMPPVTTSDKKIKKYFRHETSELIEFQKTMVGPAIGFAAFGLCSFVLGIVNTGILTNVPQAAVGIAFSYGSLGQFMAGIIEACNKNPLSAVSFMTFGSFFLALGIMLIPGTGFLAAAIAADQFEQCMGLIEIAYSITAFFIFLGTLRQPIAVRIIMVCTTTSFFFSALGSFTGVVVLTKIAGWISFVLALTAWYTLMALTLNETNSPIRVPIF